MSASGKCGLRVTADGRRRGGGRSGRPATSILAALFPLLSACGGGTEVPGPPATTPRAGVRPLTVATSVDRATVDLGDAVRYTVVVRAEPGVTPELPLCLDTIPVFLDQSGWERKVREDGGSEARKWILVDPGAGPSATFPAPVIHFTDAGGRPGEASGEEVTVEVRSRLSGGGALPDIRERLDVRLPPAPGRPGSSRGLAVAGVVAVALALMAGALLLHRRLRRRAAAAARPPWDVALEEIHAVRTEGLVARGEIELFYVRLSGTVRRYIEKRFRVMAPEMTTEEFLREARRNAMLLPPQRDLLAEFLTAADLVKFARHEPSPGDSEEALSSAERFIRDTMPPTGGAAAPPAATPAEAAP